MLRLMLLLRLGRQRGSLERGSRQATGLARLGLHVLPIASLFSEASGVQVGRPPLGPLRDCIRRSRRDGQTRIVVLLVSGHKGLPAR